MQDRFQVGLFLKLTACFVSFAVIFASVLVICSSPLLRENRGAAAYLADAAMTEKKTLPVIVIDPGHGGEDGGACSDGGICEKDINLSIALYLAEICRASGLEYRLTRSEDVMLYTDGKPTRKMQDLSNRLKLTEDGDCVFISIHQNKFPQSSCRGAQVYYSPNDPDSEKLAAAIQNGVKNALQPDNARNIKKAGSEIYLLDRAQVPAVLVECGFLSNKNDLDLLTAKDYRKKLACVIYAAILGYLSDNNETEG